MQAHALVHAPAEVLVEGARAGEHLFHILDLVNAPRAKVLVKFTCIVKCREHVHRVVEAPAAEWSVKLIGEGEQLA